ncbi:universal stress protein [Streptomyces kronopolitis]|uniref:universal stress protein n=1 Tax=Streptomyces kronopolitis TaxID=1612435 RepID=UPI003697E3BE
MAGVTRVVVGVNGSLSSLTALHRGVEEARHHGALLVPVLAWTPSGGDLSELHRPYLSMLHEREQAARWRLDTAFAQAFGGYPGDLRIRPVIAQAEAGRALVTVAKEADDLLVVCTGRRGGLHRLFHRSVSRYCLAHAACAVIAVPPPRMLADLNRATRRSIARSLLSPEASMLGQ